MKSPARTAPGEFVYRPETDEVGIVVANMGCEIPDGCAFIWFGDQTDDGQPIVETPVWSELEQPPARMRGESD